MITLNKLAFDLINIVRGGIRSDDDTLSLREVKFWIHNTRALLISRDLDKHRSISNNITQSLGCIDVSSVDASACCGVSVNCTVIRTNTTIPNPIEISAKDLITRVGPVDLTAPGYTIIPYQRVAWAGKSKWTKTSIFAFLHESYIYVMGGKEKNINLFKKINVQGVFEDPTEVKTFKNCVGSPCYTDDSEYPISGKHVEVLKQMILQSNLKIATKAPSATSGDAKSNFEAPIIERARQ